MAGKRKAAIIQDVAFTGTESLTANDLKRLVVSSFKDAPKTLLEDYENTPIVFVGMTLSDDNSRIENSTAVSGGLLRGASVNASKIWKFDAHEVQLNFEPIDLSVFQVNRLEIVLNYNPSYHILNQNYAILSYNESKIRN